MSEIGGYQPQEPASGISAQYEYPGALSYHIECECSSPDHAHNLWVETDEDCVSVTIFAKVETPAWGWGRIRQAIKMLWQGCLDAETTVLLKPQAAQNYAHALKTSAEKVAAHRKARNRPLGDE